MAARRKMSRRHAAIEDDAPQSIDLRDMSACGRLFDKGARAYYGRAASFCIRHNTPKGAITLRFVADGTALSIDVSVHQITAPIRAVYADTQDANEHGAYGLALLLAATQMGLVFAERSFKGPGFDFYLRAPGPARWADHDDIFGNRWGLEVSGILTGNASDIQRRQKKKRLQVAAAAKLLPVLVAIVEFSEPCAIFELQES